MKKFRVTYLKKNTLSILKGSGPQIFAEQIINTEETKIDIPVYPGLDLMAIIEILPEITIKDEKITD